MVYRRISLNTVDVGCESEYTELAFFSFRNFLWWLLKHLGIHFDRHDKQHLPRYFIALIVNKLRTRLDRQVF